MNNTELDMRETLYSRFLGEGRANRALLAYLGSRHGTATAILDAIDAAVQADVNGARDLADAIQHAARDVR